MIKYYLKIGIRNILKYKIFSFINIFGLATAMAVSLILILVLSDQNEFDQFNEKKDNIYRVLTKKQSSNMPNASSPFPLAATMEQNYPYVEKATHLLPRVGGDVFFTEQDKYAEMRGFFADQDFFDVFSFDLVKGDKYKALKAANSMVITTSKAEQLFRDENPIGKTVRFASRGLPLIKLGFGGEKEAVPEDWGLFTITGVLDDSEYKSHLKFDILISEPTLSRLVNEEKMANYTNDWQQYSNVYTYVLVKPGTNEGTIQASLREIVKTNYSDDPELASLQLLTQGLNDINPGLFLGNPTSFRLPLLAYQILMILAALVMLAACFNYTNLSIARLLTRVKEIGVRKVSGAHRRDLIFQFLSEAILISLFALIVANGMLFLLKSMFGNIWLNQLIDINLTMNLKVLVIFIGYSIIIGFLAGFYPSMVLSRYSPVKALNSSKKVKPGKLGFRKVLNIMQFSFSLFFIITSVLIAQQYNYINNLRPDFKSENIINIPIQGNDYELLTNEFTGIAGVTDVSACELLPGMLEQNGVRIKRSADSEEIWKGEYNSVSEGFVENLGLKVLVGSNFNSQSQPNEILINEWAVKAMGFESPADAIGQTIVINGEPVVRGVIENFNFQASVVGTGKMPLVLSHIPDRFNYINVTVASSDLRNTVDLLKDKWKTIDPVHPFKFYLYEDQLSSTNMWMGDIVSIISFITIILVIISCLGLLGMTIYTTERRTKEVGIRKALGASQGQISIALGKSYVTLILISMAIAMPLSYLVNSMWLESLPNKVDLGLGTFFSSAILMIVLVIFTIGFQILSVTKTDPVKALKFE